MVETAYSATEESSKIDKNEIMNDILYGATKGLGKLMFKYVNNLKIEGKENVPMRGKAILTTISKNPIRDMVLISQVSGRKIHFMLDPKLMKQKVVGPFLKRLGMFRSTLDKDDKEPINKVFEILNEKKELVAMTPEEKLGRETIIKAMASIIKFAIAGDAPIVPIAIYQRTNKLLNLIPTNTLVVRVGTPVKLDRKLNRDKYRPKRYEAAEEIVNIIEHLANETPVDDTEKESSE
ncbi:MAG: lysophospholipid acyltransferase family protein [Promethearchaeia archaeon]